MLKDFKEFVMKGNVLDMAVGIIIGAAFGKIISSLVGDILMPPIGKILGGVDFSNIFIDLSGGSHATLKAAQDAGAATINVGVFLNAIINFLIVAAAIFLLVRAVSRMRKEGPPAPAPETTKSCPHCLSAIPLKATRCAFCTSEVKAA